MPNPIENVITVLTEHNKWRNGEAPYGNQAEMPYDSELVTFHLNYACKYLKVFMELSKETRALLDAMDNKKEKKND